MTVTRPIATQDGRAAKQPRDTVWLLSIYLFCLMAIPSRYVFAPLGGVGAVSTVLGVVFFVLYLLRWLNPAYAVGAFKQPLKAAAIGIYCAFVAAYISGSLTKMPPLVQNGADRSLIIISSWVGLMLLTADSVESLERFNTLVRRMVFGATCMAALGITQFFTGLNIAQYIVIPGLTAHQAYTDISVRGSFNRPSATAIHPIEFGFVLVVILPLAIHQARFAGPKLARRRWFQVLLIAMTLPMTVSRSAILGLAIALVLIVPTWPRRERWAAVGVIVAGILAIQALVPGMIRTLSNLFLAIGNGSDASAHSRTSAFSGAAPFIDLHPLFGTGFGTFMSQIYFYTDDQYLNSAIELGLVGVLAMLVLFGTGFATARRIRSHTANPEIRHLGLCLSASCAIIFVGYALFDAFYFPMAAGVTFLMLGMVAAVWRLAVLERTGTQNLPELLF